MTQIKQLRKYIPSTQQLTDVYPKTSVEAVYVNPEKTLDVELAEIKTSIAAPTGSDYNVQCWGDSLTAAGKYQLGIALALGIDNSKVLNYGLASDFSQHVRRRFTSFFTASSAYRGTAVYDISQPIATRQATLLKDFFVIWIGSNNLINGEGRSNTYTINNSSYTALQPAQNQHYDTMYSASYVSQMLEDIKSIVAYIPTGRFVIIGGHGGFSSSSAMQLKMNELDEYLLTMYPKNFINLRKLMMSNYDHLSTSVSASFIKAAVNSSVSITLSDASWIDDPDKNPSGKICIGTKEMYDTYEITSVASNVVTAKLLVSGALFATGETILPAYDFVSDLGRCLVNMPTKVYSYDDILFESLGEIPRSATSDTVHLTDSGYALAGQIIGREIKKMII